MCEEWYYAKQYQDYNNDLGQFDSSQPVENASASKSYLVIRNASLEAVCRHYGATFTAPLFLLDVSGFSN